MISGCLIFALLPPPTGYLHVGGAIGFKLPPGQTTFVDRVHGPIKFDIEDQMAASGMVFDRNSRRSRVSNGTLCTRLVAPISSSAGSPVMSSLVLA